MKMSLINWIRTERAKLITMDWVDHESQKEKIYKYIHLKLCMRSRTVLKRLIKGLYLPDKTFEKYILDYVGYETFEYVTY